MTNRAEPSVYERCRGTVVGKMTAVSTALTTMPPNQDDMNEQRKHGIRFDPTVNLGHVLTFIGFILAGFGAWTTLDKRIVVLEENRRAQALVDENQDQRLNYTNEGVKSVLHRLENQIERLNNRLDNVGVPNGVNGHTYKEPRP